MKKIFFSFLCFSMVQLFAQIPTLGLVVYYPYNHTGTIIENSPNFSFSSSSEFSVSLCCNFNSLPYNESTLIWYGTLDQGNFVWSVGTWNGQLAFGCAKQQSAWTIIGTSLSNFSTSKWYHIVTVYRNGKISFYVNGQLKSSDQYNNSYAQSKRMPFSIGVTYVGDREPWNYFNGEIDCVRIYDRALTSNEILRLYSEN